MALLERYKSINEEAYCSHCAKDFLIVKKIQPNLFPAKTIPIGCVDLNYKMKFAICHWT